MIDFVFWATYEFDFAVIRTILLETKYSFNYTLYPKPEIPTFFLDFKCFQTINDNTRYMNQINELNQYLESRR